MSTCYVIERGGSHEYSVQCVVDTIEKVIKITRMTELLEHPEEDDDVDNWNEFIAGESNTFKYDDRWKITRATHT